MQKTVNVTIGGNRVEVKSNDDIPISINYALEDPQNFQNKKSGTSFGLKLPATKTNDVAANTYHNPDVMDLTTGEVFRSAQKAVIEADGDELLVGKAFLQTARHTDQPKEYEYNLYGDNADWLIDLREKTIYDFLKQISFTFSTTTIQNSWFFDGTDPNLPYVFAPVRYRDPMGGYSIVNNESVPNDNNVEPSYMRPSLSVYWILYWGFRSIGYRISSNFFDTPYFRRLVMPWTWGNFVQSEGTLFDVHKFQAAGTRQFRYTASFGNFFQIADLQVTNDSVAPAYDNNGDYTYNAGTRSMVWVYNTPHFGPLEANLSMRLNLDLRIISAGNANGGKIDIWVQWYHNGSMFDGKWGAFSVNGNLIYSQGIDGGYKGIVDSFCKRVVNNGDNIRAQVIVRTYRPAGTLPVTMVAIDMLEYKMDYFRIPMNGTINFNNYTGLQKYKFLDLFAGIIDAFNLSLNTDSVSKIVYIEPTHAYSLTADLSQNTNPGYFNGDYVQWDEKGDYSKEWEMENFSDYERELFLKFKDDPGDGILKKIQDRAITTVGQGKYVFPERFKTGKKEVENRFFSPVMHYDADQWKTITGIAPQLICLIPENVSGTSNSESANTFTPKLAYYKGAPYGSGAWIFDNLTLTSFPFMFAVNYKPGGENDPCLSYSDEKISSGGTSFVVAKGLLRRFYLPRLAIIRNGQYYNTWLKLNNKDVSGLHREFKVMGGQRWELIQIKDYKPLLEESTACLLRKWAPVEQRDSDNVFPSAAGVLGNTTTSSFEIKYASCKALTSDIPIT